MAGVRMGLPAAPAIRACRNADDLDTTESVRFWGISFAGQLDTSARRAA
jgi:hypothetical protein